MGIQHLSKVQEPKGTDSVVSQCVTRITKKFKLPVDYSWLRCYTQPCPESPSVSSKPCITLDIGLSRFCCIEPGSPPRESEVAQHVLSGIPKIVLGNLTISGSTILLHLQLTPQRCAPVDTPIQVGGRGGRSSHKGQVWGLASIQREVVSSGPSYSSRLPTRNLHGQGSEARSVTQDASVSQAHVSHVYLTSHHPKNPQDPSVRKDPLPSKSQESWH